MTLETDARLRDAERSQGLLLDAGLAEFAEFGLAGARIDRIAQRAGLNKRLIYYYFEDKERLFQAVLERAYAHIRAEEGRQAFHDLPPSEAIRRMVEFTWRYYLAHPEFLTLLNSANLHKARHLNTDSVKVVNSPLVPMIAEILERGQASGEFRGGVDAMQLYISIAGLSYFYLSNNYTLSAVFDRDLMAPRPLNERLSHMCDVVLGYLLRG